MNIYILQIRPTRGFSFVIKLYYLELVEGNLIFCGMGSRENYSGSVGLLVSPSVRRSVGPSVGRSVGRSFGWLAGRLVGWSAGRSASKIIILSFRVSTSNNENTDHQVKETCAIRSMHVTYETDHISLLRDSTVSNARNVCFLSILM